MATEKDWWKQSRGESLSYRDSWEWWVSRDRNAFPDKDMAVGKELS